jgi:Rrf2 family protein
MLEIARRQHEDRPTSLASVAEGTGISRGYLDHVAQALRGARLVRGVPGRNGGYRLARPAEKIDLAEILRAAIGPLCIVECVDDLRNGSTRCGPRWSSFRLCSRAAAPPTRGPQEGDRPNARRSEPAAAACAMHPCCDGWRAGGRGRRPRVPGAGRRLRSCPVTRSAARPQPRFAAVTGSTLDAAKSLIQNC